MEENKTPINPEIVEDMPDFEENTAENPCESEKSVDECTDDSENAILNEEKEAESADTDAEKAEEAVPNLPAGFTFNPLVIAIRPLLYKAMADDALFADEVKVKENRKDNPKSLAECAEYIMGEAYEYASKNRQGNFGLAGMSDEMIVGLIKHYYDEDGIVIRKVGNAKAKVAKTQSATAPKKDGKKEKKAKEKKEKPVSNVVDITKAITASTKGEGGKKGKKKDNLKEGFVPMERPDTLKDARKGSREQAKSVEQMDMFADFFASEEE